MKRLKLFPDTPPPGPFRASFWRSPLRGPWLTAALGSILLGLVTIVAVTGFLSHIAYQPELRGNAIVPLDRDLPLPGLTWPAGPTFLYAVTQGLHVNVGLVAVPFLLAKLWSVIPRLFAWPPVTSPAQAIERLSIALLVASAGFEFATGIVNVQYWYAFKFNFVVAHYYGAIVFVASLVIHVAVKTPIILRAYRERGVLRPLRDDLERTRPEPPDPDGLVPAAPSAPTLSRRGLFAFVGAGSLALLVANAGQTIGGPLRPLAFLAPRRGTAGDGPTDFPVNKTASSAGITPEMVSDEWRLELAGGPAPVRLSRAELLAMELRTESLPIACVEGWTTTQAWTGVPLAALARRAGVRDPADAFVESLQPGGVLSRASLNGGQVTEPRALLALQVNGVDLSMDHGFPARIIVPALPGVHNTKWVARMTFAARA